MLLRAFPPVTFENESHQYETPCILSSWRNVVVILKNEEIEVIFFAWRKNSDGLGRYSIPGFWVLNKVVAVKCVAKTLKKT